MEQNDLQRVGTASPGNERRPDFLEIRSAWILVPCLFGYSLNSSLYFFRIGEMKFRLPLFAPIPRIGCCFAFGSHRWQNPAMRRRFALSAVLLFLAHGAAAAAVNPAQSIFVESERGAVLKALHAPPYGATLYSPKSSAASPPDPTPTHTSNATSPPVPKPPPLSNAASHRYNPAAGKQQGVSSALNPDGSIDITWKTVTVGTQPIEIDLKKADGSWRRAIMVPPDATSVHIPPQ
jgi:hypothetical protein